MGLLKRAKSDEHYYVIIQFTLDLLINQHHLLSDLFQIKKFYPLGSSSRELDIFQII